MSQNALSSLRGAFHCDRKPYAQRMAFLMQKNSPSEEGLSTLTGNGLFNAVNLSLDFSTVNGLKLFAVQEQSRNAVNLNLPAKSLMLLRALLTLAEFMSAFSFSISTPVEATSSSTLASSGLPSNSKMAL